MKWFRVALLIVLVPVAFSGCKLKEEKPAGPVTIPAPSDVAAPPANALKTASGISYKVLTVGLGSAHPSARSMVTVHYTGWTTDGTMFDSSVAKGDPITMELSSFIPGWVEVLQLMVPGEKCRVWIPGNLAYDNDPRPEVPKGMLVFEIELIAIR